MEYILVSSGWAIQLRMEIFTLPVRIIYLVLKSNLFNIVCDCELSFNLSYIPSVFFYHYQMCKSFYLFFKVSTCKTDITFYQNIQS